MGTEELIAEGLQELVDGGGLAGAVTACWRGGERVQRAAVGWSDREVGRALRPDAIFRVASMSKPITSVLALQLWEEGRFALEQPVQELAPELAAPRVLRSLDALDDTVPAERPLTFLDLMTHRAGFTYGGFHEGPLAQAYWEALGADIDSLLAPDAWIAALGRLPLVDQPGRTLHYGHSTDLLGLLLARMMGQPLDALMRERVLSPLGMVDTGFVVPESKRGRRARLYGFDEEGGLKPLSVAPGGATLPERPEDLSFMSGGQGLWSTVDDYLRFARLFIGDGAVDGVRLLRSDTLARMRQNQLTPEQRASAEVGGVPVFARGHGFGLGVATVIEPEQAAPQVCQGSPGTVGWPGAYGGWWQADPSTGTATVFLTHSLVEREQLAAGVGWETFAAIELVHSLSRPAP